MKWCCWGLPTCCITFCEPSYDNCCAGIEGGQKCYGCTLYKPVKLWKREVILTDE